MKMAENIEKKGKQNTNLLVELKFDFWYDFPIFLGV